MNRSKTQGDLSSPNKYTSSKESNDDKKHKDNNITIKSNSIYGYDKKYYPSSGDRHEGYYNSGLRHGLGIYLWFNGIYKLYRFSIIYCLFFLCLYIHIFRLGDKYTGDWEYGILL